MSASITRGAGIVEDGALLLAIFLTPVVWGKLDVGGLALLLGLVAAAGLAGLVRGRLAGSLQLVRTPLDWPIVAFVVISAAACFTSVSAYISVLETLRVLGGALLFWLLINRPAGEGRPTAFVVAALGAGVLVFLALWSSGGPEEVIRETLLHLVVFVGAVLLAVTVLAPLALGRTEWYAAALMISAGYVVALFGIAEYFDLRVLRGNTTWQIFSTFLNQNALGGFLAMASPVAFAGAIWSRRSSSRALWITGAALMAIALYLTGSKGAWLAYLIASLLFVFLFAAVSPRRALLLRLLAAGLIVVLLAAGLALLLRPSVVHRLASPLSLDKASNMFRYLTWKATIPIIADHPWLGVGPRAFERVYPQYAIGGYTTMAHETYLQVAAETGFPGLAAFLAIVAAVFGTGIAAFRRLQDPSRRLLIAAGLSGIVVLLLHSLVDYGWYIGATGLTFWLLAALIVRAGAPLPQEATAPVAKARGRRHRRAEAPPAAPPVPGVIGRLTEWRPGRMWPVVLAVGGLALLVLAFLGITAYRAASAYETARSYERSDLAQASASYRQAIALAPWWAEPRARLALVLAGSEPAEADREIARAIALEPTNGAYRYFLAWVRMAQMDEEGAAAAFRQTLARNPHNVRARRDLGRLYLSGRDFRRALAEFDQLASLENSPFERYKAIEFEVKLDYAIAHYWLALGAWRGWPGAPAGGVARAREELDKVIALGDRYARLGYILQEYMKAAGREDPTEQEEVRVLRAKANYRMAELNRQTGNTAEAERHQAEATKIDPDVAEKIAIEDRNLATEPARE